MIDLPFADDELPMDMRERAQQIAAEVRLRVVPCTCAACVIQQNLPAVQRILAAARARLTP
jgi:hypothetical protein